MIVALAVALLTMTSLRATRMLLALFALDFGAEAWVIGLLGAAFSLAPLFLSIVVGRLSDRIGARMPLIVGALTGAAGILVPVMLPGITTIFVAALLCGVSAACYIGPTQNLIGHLSSKDNRARSFSNLSLMLALASFVGPVATGWTIDTGGFDRACVLIALLTLVPVALLMFAGAGLPKGAAAVDGEAGRGAAGIMHSGLVAMLVASAIVQCGLDMFQYYMPTYGSHLRLSASAIGVIVAMYSVSAIMVRFAMPSLVGRFRQETVLGGALLLGAVSFALMPAFDNAIALGVMAFLFGAGMGLGQPITMMMTYAAAPAGRSGEALGLRLTVNNVTQVAAPVLVGIVGTLLGLSAVFWSVGLALASGAVLTRWIDLKPGK